jgi:hypothetical protein
VSGASWINGGFDVFLLKYDLDENLLWSRTRGQPGQPWDAALTMALDNNRDVVLGGYTQPGGVDVYILEYGADGTLHWEWTLFGAANVEEVIDITVGDYGAGIELAPDGNIFAAGAAWENGSQNGMTLLKYTADGKLLWSRSERAGYYSAECNDLAVDADGAAYMSGFAFNESDDFQYLTGKYDGSGNLVWTAAWEAPEGRTDTAYHVRVGADQRVYVIGDAWRGFAPYFDITTVVYNQNEATGIGAPEPVRRLVLASPSPVIVGGLVTVRGTGTSPVEIFAPDGRRILKIERDTSFRASSPGVFLVRAGGQSQKLVIIGK